MPILFFIVQHNASGATSNASASTNWQLIDWQKAIGVVKNLQARIVKAVKVEKGSHDNPTMTLAADSQDYKDIVTGKTNPMNAFMQGKVKLEGNLNLAMKFAEMFKLS